MNHPLLFSFPPLTDLTEIRRQLGDRPWLSQRIELVNFGPAPRTAPTHGRSLPAVALAALAGAIGGATLGLWLACSPQTTADFLPIWCGTGTTIVLAAMIGAAAGSLIGGAMTLLANHRRSLAARERLRADAALETVVAVDAHAPALAETRAFFAQWQAVELGQADAVSAKAGRKISHRLALVAPKRAATMIA